MVYQFVALTSQMQNSSKIYEYKFTYPFGTTSKAVENCVKLVFHLKKSFSKQTIALMVRLRDATARL